MSLQIRFPENKIKFWAQRYNYSRNEESLERLKPQIQNVGYLSKEDLWAVARWKAPRSAGYTKKNDEGYVKEITHWALSAKEERSRIEVLTLLNGVLFPTASVILHLYHTQPYPIIDYRALWSVGVSVPNQYRFDFWWEYANYCQSLAKRCSVDMRTLDKALWQYSKENQPAK